MSEEILVVNPDNKLESEKILEEKGIGKRGKDKNPRKMNINSLHNLKPLQKKSETFNPISYTNNSQVYFVIGGILVTFLLVILILKISEKLISQKNEE